MADAELRFLEAFEGLSAAFQESFAAVEAIRACLAQMQAAQQPPPQPPPVLTRLQTMVPSFQLTRYLQQQASGARSCHPETPSRLHDSYSHLTTRLQDAAVALQRMRDACAAHARQLACRPAASPPAAGDACRPAEAPPQQQQPGARPTDEQQQEPDEQQRQQQQQQQHSAGGGDLSPEDVALMMQALVAGAVQELSWMELAAQSITIATPAEEVESYCELWRLQPFTDDDLLEALQQHALPAPAAT